MLTTVDIPYLHEPFLIYCETMSIIHRSARKPQLHNTNNNGERREKNSKRQTGDEPHVSIK